VIITGCPKSMESGYLVEGLFHNTQNDRHKTIQEGKLDNQSNLGDIISSLKIVQSHLNQYLCSSEFGTPTETITKDEYEDLGDLDSLNSSGEDQDKCTYVK